VKHPQQAGIRNRSPWLVSVRHYPALSRTFSFSQKKAAEAYLAEAKAQGQAATLVQQATAFELRGRRAGACDQFLTFDTLEQAVQAKLKMDSDFSLHIVRDYSAAVRHTLQNLMTRYIKEVAPQHKGGDIEIQRLKRIGRDEDFVDKPLASLSTEDLQDFITERLAEVAPATVDRDLDVLSQVLRYADDVWKIAAAENPFKGLRRPKYFNERDRRLQTGEEKRLLAAVADCRNPYVDCIVLVALDTAMRRGEILSLRWEAVDYTKRFALLPETKNGRSRKVPLTTRVMKVLQELQAESGNTEGAVFPVTANAFKLAFGRAVERAGIVDLHFHDLRHESISRFAESGRFELVELQAISGHRDTRMLLRYMHLCTQGLAAKMDAASTENREEYIHRGRKRLKGLAGALAMPAAQASGTAWESSDTPSSQDGLRRAETSNVVAFPGCAWSNTRKEVA